MKKNPRSNYWKNKKAIIVIHEATVGPGHDLRDYFLKQEIKELLFISHPLLYMPEMYKNSSRYELYKNGELVKSHKSFHWKLPEPLLYVKDIFYTFLWSVNIVRQTDVFVGVANINALCGVLLRWFGFAHCTIYYVIDYVPKRFNNSYMNAIYHFVDKFAAEYCDWTWNLSPRMNEGREEKWKKKFSKQLVVPHGVHYARIKRHSFAKINKHEIIYMGTIYRKQGIQIVLEALPKIINKIPDVKFSIIGKGPYVEELKALTRKLRLEKYVEFLGYIAEHSEMENRLAKASIAVALYDRRADINDFTYYADPGKIKNYLGAGVPILMTDVAYVARQVEKAKCGFIVGYSKEEVSDALINFFSNNSLVSEYRSNALNFAKKYEWDVVFTEALQKITTKN